MSGKPLWDGLPVRLSLPAKADARHDEVRGDVRAGLHVSPSKSVTVKEAGASWIKVAESGSFERATIKQYREHVDRHIVPFIGVAKSLSRRRYACRIGLFS